MTDLDDTTTGHQSDVTRRVVLRGATVGGLALPFLAACGAGDEAGDAPSASPSPSESSSSAAPSSAAPSETTGGATGPSVAASDVPVGSGTIVKEGDETYVVTQPSKGDFKAFDGICTHQKCPVTDINSDRQIHCSCHDSLYSIEDGSVQGGPAPAPLAELGVTVQGDQVVIDA